MNIKFVGKIVLSACLLLGFSWQANEKAFMSLNQPFLDITDIYGEQAIQRLYGAGIVNGTGPGKYEPNKPVNRSEFVTMLGRVFHLEPVIAAIPAFTDVGPSDWYYGFVQAALNTGIAEGTGQGMFQPDNQLTRQEASILLVRALKQSPSHATAAPFKDSNQSAAWALPYVNKAYQLGFVEGDQGFFRPNDPITRQETAVLLDRIVSNPQWDVDTHAVTTVPIQLGWQYGQTTEEYKSSVVGSPINTLSPRWFFLDATGTIKDNSDPSLVSWAHEHQKQVWAMFGNRFDQQLTHRYLTDAELKQKAIAQLVELVRKYELDGINVDFENLDPADRSEFTSFVGALAEAIQPIGAKLSVDVPPDLATEWSAPYDYAALAQKADYIVLMGYEEHWAGCPVPGSVASFPWLRTGLTKLSSQVPTNKIIVGLPLYTRDWFETAGRTDSTDLTLKEQVRTLQAANPSLIWDDTTKQYIADYNQYGTQHRIWMEESRSLSIKVQLAANFQTAGIAYWSIGGENPEDWDAVRNILKYASYRFPAK